jgi:hypothetical protein
VYVNPFGPARLKAYKKDKETIFDGFVMFDKKARESGKGLSTLGFNLAHYHYLVTGHVHNSFLLDDKEVSFQTFAYNREKQEGFIDFDSYYSIEEAMEVNEEGNRVATLSFIENWFHLTKLKIIFNTRYEGRSLVTIEPINEPPVMYKEWDYNWGVDERTTLVSPFGSFLLHPAHLDEVKYIMV